MKSSKPPKIVSVVRKPPVLISLVLLVLAVGAYFAFRPARDNLGATAYYQVKRGDFTVSIVEAGTLSAVSEVVIRNEVEGVARIISIVPEGSLVKKGDLLVELDSSGAEDQLNQQQINFEKAKFGVQQAEAQLEIMRSATNSDYLAALLKVKFAKIDRDKYLEGQQLVDIIEASNKVVQVQAQLSFNKDTFINSTNLAAKGYETKQKVDGDRLTLLNSQNAEIVATNGVWMLERFDIPKLREKYDSDVLQAEQELERVVNQNLRKMAQYEADLLTQKNTLALSEQKLERDKKNLTATKIYAPQDGLVVYQVSENRFSSESLIEGGATVRNRQELIKLPDLSRMKLVVKVHESHVNMVRRGMPAYVVLDSAPDQRFTGIVDRVAPLPDSQSRWGNPNLKVYNTEVHITDDMPDVKPGVSAKAEILITNIADTISVPIQAVTTLKGKQVVYVLSGNKHEPRPIEVGLFNTKLIQITQGLQAGERVLLSPPFDTQEKDLEGGILDEAEKASLTNAPARKPESPTSPGQSQPGIGPITRGPGGPQMAGAPSGGNGSGGPGGFGSQGGAPADFIKQYDKDGDGQLNESEREAMRTAMAARFGGQGGAGGQGNPGGRSGFNFAEVLKQYDKDGDGQLNETEREAMRSAMGARFGAQGGGPGGGRAPSEEMIKRFDANGDGQLDETERAAMRASRQRGPGGQEGESGRSQGGSGAERQEGGRRGEGGGRNPQNSSGPSL